MVEIGPNWLHLNELEFSLLRINSSAFENCHVILKKNERVWPFIWTSLTLGRLTSKLKELVSNQFDYF